MSMVAAARISGATSQQAFDVLLGTLAEPGQVRRLPVDELPDLPRPLWLALSLADVDITVSVDDDLDSPLAALVRDATGATIVPVEDAWIVVHQTGATALPALDRVMLGTALAPEDGARLAIGVDSFGTGGLELTMSGPGVNGTQTLSVHGLDPEIADRIGQASGTFPAGFDTWLFASNGDVAAVPRTTQIERN